MQSRGRATRDLTTPVVGALLVGLFAYLLSRVYELHSDSEGWARAGVFGDAIGGISNFISMIVIAITAIYATHEVSRIRKESADEVRADAARQIWRATFGLGRDMRNLFKLVINGTPGAALMQTAQNRLEASYLQFRDALSDAELFFGPEVVGPIEEIGAFREHVFSVATNLQASSPEELEKASAELDLKLRAVEKTLRPYAALE
jgi:hypothetical protein